MEVEKVAQNLYRLHYRGLHLTVSAQDLRDVYDWCLLHMRELEQEAKQEKPETSYLDDPTRVEPGWLGDDWKAIEAQAEQDLAAIETDQDAYRFIEHYLSREMRGQLLKIYQSDRHEMNRSPQQAVKNLLSLPPL